jgi:hypothetical protein
LEGKVGMRRRKRRSSSEVKRLQDHFLQAIEQEGKVSLTALISKYGPEVDVRNTASDKNLVKRQLDQLAGTGDIEFRREGRELIAQSVPEAADDEAIMAEMAAMRVGPVDLAVIRAYAVQVEEFSRTLQEQIATLVRMVEKAAR